jgi:1,2-phenylacetyl-CoA epoxidase PaaB subunit
MPTKKDDKTEIRWRIMRITHTPAKLVGHVYAPDEDTALQTAIKQFDIEPAWRNWLLAIREN